MKKLTAMFLSLLMCFSLLTMTAQATGLPDDPDDPGIIDVGEDPTKPGDDDPDKPGYDDPDEPKNTDSQRTWPDPADDIPGVR